MKSISVLKLCVAVLFLLGVGRAGVPVPLAAQSEGAEVRPENGRVYYVAPDGDDANPGTIDHPFRTLQHAVNQVQAGETLHVRAGTYHEAVTIRNSGTAAQPITIAAYPGETPVIDGQYVLPAGDSWAGCNERVDPPICYHYRPLLSIEADYVIVQGFEITRSLGRGVRIWRGDGRAQHVTLRQNDIHDNRGAGVKVLESDHILIEDNDVWHSGDYATDDRSGSPDGDLFNPDLGWPVAVSDRRASHITYRGNRIFENWTEGIGAGVDSTDVVVEDNVLYDNRALQIYVQRAQNVVVQRNLAYCTNNPLFWRNENPPPGIVLNNEVQFDDSQTTANIKFLNNIVAGCRQNMALWGNKDYIVRDVLIAHNTLVNAHANDAEQSAVGLVVSDGNVYENVRIVNNLVYQSAGRIAGGGSAAGVTYGHNLWSQAPPEAMAGEGDVVGDPRLVNPNGDLAPGTVRPDWFALNNESPAVKAVPNRYVQDDFRQRVRDELTEIGALSVTFVSDPGKGVSDEVVTPAPVPAGVEEGVSLSTAVFQAVVLCVIIFLFLLVRYRRSRN